MSYAFGGMLHRTERDYHDAIVDAWVWADGLNDRATALEFLRNTPADVLAREILTHWEFEHQIEPADLSEAVRRLHAAYDDEDEEAETKERSRQAVLLTEHRMCNGG